VVSIIVITIEEFDCSGSCLQLPPFTGLRSLLAAVIGVIGSAGQLS